MTEEQLILLVRETSEWLLPVSFGILSVVMIIVTINMTSGPFLKRLPAASRLRKISVLIPARNEEHSIGRTLDALSRQTYPLHEIIVLDNHSSDRTTEIVTENTDHMPHLHLVQGGEIPEGWTGKNYACRQLAQRATGDILLFMDADVIPGEDAINKTVGGFENFNADALSVFPQYRFPTMLPRLLVPVMDILVYGFLPLQLIHRTRFPALSAANGKWIAFTRSMYETIGTHESVRTEIAEDVPLSQRVKSAGGRMLVASGSGIIFCEMPSGSRAAISGFTKKFYAGFGSHPLLFAGLMSIFLVAFVYPYIAFIAAITPLTSVSVMVNLFIRFLMHAQLKHGIVAAFLHPFSILFAIMVGIWSVVSHYAGGAREPVRSREHTVSSDGWKHRSG